MYINLIHANRRPLGLLATLLCGLALTTACNDEENPTIPTGQTVTQFVAGNNFSFLNAAVTKAGLGTTLSGTGPFTLFAPTDDAFRAAGFADVNVVTNTADTTLRRILLYHVISGSYPASAIPAGQTALPTSLSTNGTAYVSKTTSGTGMATTVSVNGARVAMPDGQATNGVIHAIDQVLMAPTGNVLQVVSGDTSLSLLAAAAARGGVQVVGALSGTTPLTVFAPTNAAFRAAGLGTVTAINNASTTALTGILTNHVVAPARAYSPTIMNGAITTFGTGSVTATAGTGNALTLTSRGNAGQVSNVLSNTVVNGRPVQNRDISATNGVIHKIDRVLLP